MEAVLKMFEFINGHQNELIISPPNPHVTIKGGGKGGHATINHKQVTNLFLKCTCTRKIHISSTSVNSSFTSISWIENEHFKKRKKNIV